MECLKNVVRLSRTTCECFDEGKPGDFNEGKSNIYLDELEGLPINMIEAAEDCSTGSLWDLMIKARSNAEEQFTADLLSCVGDNYKARRANYSGIVGSIQTSQTLNLTQNKAGVVLKPYNVVGGKMVVKRIGLLFNAIATFNVSIFSNEDLTNPIATYPVTSAANTLQYITLGTPLSLPLWSNDVTRLEYYVVYDLIGTYFPKNNKNCGGCGQTDANRPYASWLTIKGIKGNTPTPFNEFTETAELNGLVLDVDFRCDSTRLICSDDMPLDFESDGRAKQMAVAMRFKAGELLLEYILSSGNVNRYTMLDNERLWGKRNHFRKTYDEWIVYLCSNTEITNNDCLMCRPNNNIAKVGIFA